MDEIVKDFLIESNENLDRLDQELVKLESEPSSTDLLASIFRTIHTIKGSCGFLGFARLERVTHAGESLLSLLRDSKLTLSAEITSGLLAMVDAVRHMLTAIQASGDDGEEDYATLIELLARLQNEQAGESPVAASRESSDALPPPQPAAEGASATTEMASKQLSGPAAGRPRRKPRRKKERPDPAKGCGILIEDRQSRPEDTALAPEQKEVEGHKVGEVIAQAAAHPEESPAAQPTLEPRKAEAAAETIRVGVTLLDRLMNLVGELVLARNRLLQFSNSTQDAGFHAVSQRMNLITTELQEEVMKTRMQPISGTNSPAPCGTSLTAVAEKSGSRCRARIRNSIGRSSRPSKTR